MKKTVLQITLSCFLLAGLSVNIAFSQNGTACYKPFTNTGKVATPIQSSAVCVNCTFLNNISNATDNSTENFAEFTNVASVLANNGITIKDTVSTYPAGWFAGYVVDLGSPTSLSANVLNAFVVSTYNDGTLAESRNSGNGLAVATVAGISQGRVYLNFKTTLPFDEIRFTFSSAISGLSTFRIYYATAFDPNCGTMDNNNACGDQIAGSKARVTFNAGSASALTSISNPEFITDGSKTTFSDIVVPAGTNLLGNPPYVGILDEQKIYPAGQRVGFVMRNQASLLTADVFNSFRVETYLFGVLQEQATATGNTLSITAPGVGGNNRTISFNTTKKFNETRLVFAQPATVNIGSVGINYAFEEPQTCTSCIDLIGTGQPGVYAGTINPTRTTTNGTLCLTIPVVGDPAVLINSGRAVDADTTNFASYSFPLAGANCGFSLSVKLPDTVPRHAMVGFLVQQTGGLGNIDVLSNVTITTYRNNVIKNVSNASTLLNLRGLALPNTAKYRVGFVADSAFDEVVIRFSAGGLSVSVTGEFRTYYPFVVRDDDGDGVEDCKEVCGTANDAVDTDGDGTPNACDAAGLETPLNLKVLLQGALLSAPVSSKDLMRYDLNTLNFIPSQQPYSATLSPRFTQVGGGGSEVVSTTVLGRQGILSNILVDWVLVELRSSSNPATIVKTVSALVARNGEIVDTLGGPLMVSLPAGSYYLSVKHRNHLGVMTATATVTAGLINSIDFSTLPPAQIFGTDSLERKQLTPGVNIYALWAGDVNSNGKVKYQGTDNDANFILSAVVQAQTSGGLPSFNFDNLLGYFRADVDLSGKAKYQGLNNDANIILSNILGFMANIPGFSFNYDMLIEQLP